MTAILVDRREGVATITVNRSEVRNALDVAAWTALRSALTDVSDADSDADSIGVVVLTGAGDRAFVAGADIRELAEIREDAERRRSYVELVESVMSLIESIPQPVIAMVNGAAIGGGAELVAACDLAIAREGATLGIPAARLGLAITGQDIRRLSRRVGAARARWMLFTGDVIGAERARDWGLVQEVLPEPQLSGRVTEVARRLLQNSPASIRLMKDAFRAIDGGDFEEGLASALPAWAGEDLQEGISAYLERRSPQFRGG